MADNLKPDDRQKTMRAVKGKETTLEKRLFSMLSEMGLKKWKKNASDIAGKPDVVFFEEKIAIFADGCFWHGCPVCRRKMPQTNREYWEHKIARNVELANRHNRKLADDGWLVIRLWEHELTDKTCEQNIREIIEQAIRRQTMSIDSERQECTEIINNWILSCMRSGKISRNTIAVGIVVLDHLRKKCPVSGEDVISKGGEIKGARSGLGTIFEYYGIPASFLKEVTTRQGHQDGQRLFKQFQWGNKLKNLTCENRVTLLDEMIDMLLIQAKNWLRRQNLKLNIDRRQSPSAWVSVILENARQRSGGVVEQHLVGAKLQRRYKIAHIPNHPAHAGDRQTARAGDFEIQKLVYHVTANPTRNVIQKCSENIRSGLHPILLTPSDQENKARFLAQDEGIDKELSIISLEAFIELNIIELATDDNKDFFSVLGEIIEIYNKRLLEVETDLSLKIQLN